jgi:SAM-dependent methyltransferase
MDDGRLTAASGVDTSAAEAFETFLVPPVFGPWSRMLVEAVAPLPGERLLDVACGTGAAARHAAGLVGADGYVAALDINEGMVVHGASLDGAGAIDWRIGNALDLPWDTDHFDAAVCNQGLQFFPDRAAAVAELKRVLKPGGRLGIGLYAELPYCPGHCAVERALSRYPIDLDGIRRPYSFGDPKALGDLLEAAGFRDVAVVRKMLHSRFDSAPAFVESLAAGGPSARKALEQLDAAQMKSAIAEVTEALAEYADDDGLTIITTSNFAVARK